MYKITCNNILHNFNICLKELNCLYGELCQRIYICNWFIQNVELEVFQISHFFCIIRTFMFKKCIYTRFVYIYLNIFLMESQNFRANYNYSVHNFLTGTSIIPMSFLQVPQRNSTISVIKNFRFRIANVLRHKCFNRNILFLLQKQKYASTIRKLW